MGTVKYHSRSNLDIECEIVRLSFSFFKCDIERNVKIYRMMKEGYTKRSIASSIGVSESRVGEILRKINKRVNSVLNFEPSVERKIKVYGDKRSRELSLELKKRGKVLDNGFLKL